MSVERLLGARFGLRIDGSTQRRLDRILAEGADLADLAPGAYATLLEHDEAAMTWLVERLTVQETEFFRHPAQYAVVADAVKGPRAGVVWSAGCANGQEAWSLAMLFEELRVPGWSVLATDLSARAVARATAGVYAERELRGLSPQRRERFLRRREDGTFEVAAGLRSRVRFAQHNLVAEEPPADVDGRVVLCRNVLIYLHRPDSDRLLMRLRERMPADGILLIGAAESLPFDHPAFAAQRERGVYVYRPRLVEAQDAAVAPPVQPPRRERRAAPPARRPAPAPSPRPRPTRRAVPPLPSAADLIRAGERHAAGGRPLEAAAAFRKAAYLAPDDVLAHTRLAFALEAAGDPRAAQRAFRAARVALSRTDAAALEGELEGWSPAELARVLDDRVGGRR